MPRDLDWRLITSQAYQESTFDPEAKSWAGAVGLMQLMPATARWLDIEGDLTDPTVSVNGGTKYVRWLLGTYADEDIPFSEKMRFALASYNAGRGHVADGRTLATQMGLDPNVWYGNVEESILLLSKPEYARRARYGYCRCQEAVDYVRKIEDRYKAYVAAMRHTSERDTGTRVLNEGATRPPSASLRR